MARPWPRATEAALAQLGKPEWEQPRAHASRAGFHRAGDSAVVGLFATRDNAQGMQQLSAGRPQVPDAAGCATVQPAVMARPHIRQDMRGRGTDRSSWAKRKKWVPHVMQHMSEAVSGRLLSDTDACLKDCPREGRCLEDVCSISTLKGCAVESFGPAVLAAKHDAQFGYTADDPAWIRIKGNHEAVKDWFDLARSYRIEDDCGNAVVKYKVADRHVCRGGCASAPLATACIRTPC